MAKYEWPRWLYRLVSYSLPSILLTWSDSPSLNLNILEIVCRECGQLLSLLCTCWHPDPGLQSYIVWLKVQCLWKKKINMSCSSLLKRTVLCLCSEQNIKSSKRSHSLWGVLQFEQRLSVNRNKKHCHCRRLQVFFLLFYWLWCDL